MSYFASMKSFIAFFLIISLSLASMNKSLIYFSYQVNKDFISKHLCENRDKPQLHCNGKCQFVKKLKEDEKRDNLPVNIKNNFEIQLYSEKVFEYDFNLFYVGEFYSVMTTLQNISPTYAIFHPPQI